ncbi:S1 family peptidase [Halorubrum ruber]|uniref:Trypsin-like peptidase domain-containing protein n=1 Tax=Halorubrum ruber TaxID=2982524 RepID=A0A8T8LIT0_9EURY|nr:serine protease [Halorubrum ruber]QUO46825.1 trypsin-like peptidase domain-containing protein [Halorubrum ruber]
MASINPVYSTVTMIKVGNRDDFATGFFYNFLDDTYLVTNKHVLEPDDNVPADEVRFFIRSYNNLGDVNWITKSVEEGSQIDWYEMGGNDGSDNDIDVAVIPINQKLSDFSDYINNNGDESNIVTGSTAFSPHMLMDGDDVVSGGDTVLVIGYPDGLLDSQSYIPLLRNARISTPYGLPFQDDPKFITDAMMYPGMSGSPIVAGPRTLKNPATGGLRTSSRGFALLGIHSDNYQREMEDDFERLNLNAGWYAQILNLIIINQVVQSSDNPEKTFDRIDSEYPDIREFDSNLIASILRHAVQAE